jgi:hypothetical protein
MQWRRDVAAERSSLPKEVLHTQSVRQQRKRYWYVVFFDFIQVNFRAPAQTWAFWTPLISPALVHLAALRFPLKVSK